MSFCEGDGARDYTSDPIPLQRRAVHTTEDKTSRGAALARMAANAKRGGILPSITTERRSSSVDLALPAERGSPDDFVQRDEYFLLPAHFKRNLQILAIIVLKVKLPELVRAGGSQFRRAAQ
jgi:hypothetical protein